MKIILILLFPLFGFSQTYKGQICSSALTIKTVWDFADYQTGEYVTISGSMPGPYIVFLPAEGPGIDTPQHNVVIEFPWGNNPCCSPFGVEFDFSQGTTIVQQGITRQICSVLPVTISYVGIQSGYFIFKTDIESGVEKFEVQTCTTTTPWKTVATFAAKGAGTYSYRIPNNSQNAAMPGKGPILIGLLILAGTFFIGRKRAAIGLLCAAMLCGGLACKKGQPNFADEVRNFFRAVATEFNGVKTVSPVVMENNGN